jgi:hypothetical protein
MRMIFKRNLGFTLIKISQKNDILAVEKNAILLVVHMWLYALLLCGNNISVKKLISRSCADGLSDKGTRKRQKNFENAGLR